MSLKRQLVKRFLLGTIFEGYTPENEFIFEFYKDENNLDATRVLYYKGNRTSIRVPPSFHKGNELIPTRKIEATCFNYCDKLTSITFPEGVVEIG